MSVLQIVLAVLLMVLGVFLIVAVLLQKSKSQGLSGTIAGGAETFYGKGMGSKKEKILSIATLVAAILFVVLAITIYCLQYTGSESTVFGDAWKQFAS